MYKIPHNTGKIRVPPPGKAMFFPSNSSYVPSTIRWRNLKTQQSAVIMDFCLRKIRAGECHDYRDVIVYEKLRFLKCFPSTLKRQAGVFKFLWFEKRFRKAQFSWRISVDGRPNRRNEAAFANSPDVVRTGPSRNVLYFNKLTQPTILQFAQTKSTFESSTFSNSLCPPLSTCIYYQLTVLTVWKGIP